MNDIFIHESAFVEDGATLGNGTKVWINSQIRKGAIIGRNCIISKDTFIDADVTIGNNCKVQNSVSVYHGVTIGNDVFVGPNVSFTNDKIPRAFSTDWKITKTFVENGASLGANSTIICGVKIGEYAMVAAGSVVTKDVKPYSLVMGNPARHYSYVDKMGNKVEEN
ncbi:MAG: N-acetyltransferase [Candidatus Cloacimonadota bacterium]|nr:MAG: N-acetyltransferase [Candidatus Cloacimonadota bacterium]